MEDKHENDYTEYDRVDHVAEDTHAHGSHLALYDYPTKSPSRLEIGLQRTRGKSAMGACVLYKAYSR